MKRTYLRNTLLLSSPFLFAGVLFTVLSSTDPVVIGPGGVLAVFTLVYLFCLSIVFVLLHFGVSWVSRFVLKQRDVAHVQAFSIGVRKAYYIASVLAFAPVILLAMQSFAQLRWTDVLLVVVFMLVAVFYIIKRG